LSFSWVGLCPAPPGPVKDNPAFVRIAIVEESGRPSGTRADKNGLLLTGGPESVLDTAGYS